MSWHTSIIAIKKNNFDVEEISSYPGYKNRIDSLGFEDATSVMAQAATFFETDEWIIGLSVISGMIVTILLINYVKKRNQGIVYRFNGRFYWIWTAQISG